MHLYVHIPFCRRICPYCGFYKHTPGSTPIAAFIGVGVFWGSFAAMLPDLKARLAVSDATLGLILLGSAAGALLAMWLSPRLDAALPRRGLTLSGLALGAVVLPLGLAETLLPFVIGMIAIGSLWLVSDADARPSAMKLPMRGRSGGSHDSSRDDWHPDHRDSGEIRPRVPRCLTGSAPGVS